jgi:hypothetical protein
MRHLVIVLLAVLVVLLPVGGIGGDAATIQPRLRLIDTDPGAFRGLGFKAHERVRVSVYAGGCATKRVAAGVRGGFRRLLPLARPERVRRLLRLGDRERRQPGELQALPGYVPAP